jgi:hypothetical protein
MAITIRQNADTPNLGNNRLVYAITSNSSSNAQYRYVLDILDKDDNLLQRIKQQPNPNDTGIFDIGQIVTNYLGPTDEVWTTFVPEANTNVGKDLKIRFGEEWASSPTSSAILYVGSEDIAGAPSVSSSVYNFIIDGVQDPNTPGFDWDWASKYDEESTDGLTTFTHQNGLTAFDTSKVRRGDYQTISFLRGNARGTGSAAVDNGYAQDVYAATYRQYSSDGTLLDTDTLIDTFSGLRTLSTQLWDDVYTSQDENTRLVHWPVGPQNIEDAGVAILCPDCEYYTVTFYNQTQEPGINTNGVWGEYTFTLCPAACDFPGTRFAWKNEYGVWDYFNFNLADSTTSNVQRESYEQNFVNYSGTNTAPYSAQRRGITQFQNKISQAKTAESDYLTQTEADNLRELFYSTNVYVQDGSTFYPVVIENASVTEKTNPRSQKLFRYTVNYRYANQPQARV